MAEIQECRTYAQSTYTGYIIVHTGAVDHPRHVEVPLTPATRDGANILCIYSGTAVCALKGESTSSWTRRHMHIYIPTAGRQWVDLPAHAPIQPDQTRFIGGTAMAAPAAVYNDNVSNDAGWAVDAAWVQLDNGLQVAAHVAVRDSDGYLYRVGYHATVLGREYRDD